MTFSLNEIEATSKKAARGAGYPWGLAEEAGRATRWLCAQGLDGCGALARLLEMDFARDLPAHAPPAGLSRAWQAPASLCPLLTGAALSDYAAALKTAAPDIGPVAAPLLLVPFVAAAARQTGVALALTGPGFAATTDGSTLWLAGKVPQTAPSLTIASADAPAAGTPQRAHSRATPATADWDILNRLAHRTYAPATEESRLLGAGAGLSDND